MQENDKAVWKDQWYLWKLYLVLFSVATFNELSCNKIWNVCWKCR